MKRAEQELANILKDDELTIALAESITCGLATHKLGTISGTSEVLKGSIICYHESSKVELLKIKKADLEKYTAESQQITDKLAKSLSKVIKADIHAAITGLAAEGGSETKEKPVGTVFFSFLFEGKIYNARKLFRGSPLLVKEKACENFFRFISSTIRELTRAKREEFSG